MSITAGKKVDLSWQSVENLLPSLYAGDGIKTSIFPKTGVIFTIVAITKNFFQSLFKTVFFTLGATALLLAHLVNVVTFRKTGIDREIDKWCSFLFFTLGKTLINIPLSLASPKNKLDHFGNPNRSNNLIPDQGMIKNWALPIRLRAERLANTKKSMQARAVYFAYLISVLVVRAIQLILGLLLLVPALLVGHKYTKVAQLAKEIFGAGMQLPNDILYALGRVLNPEAPL